MITQAKIDEYNQMLEARKAKIPDGPWKKEPNRIEFEHAGLRCLLSRNPSLAWCGYVGVSPGHPAHGKDYYSVDASVHGGLTYSDACGGVVCHVAENDTLWWLGFDCSHWRDLIPGMLELPERHRPKLGDEGEIYRDVAYVTAETKSLAEQLAAMKAAA